MKGYFFIRIFSTSRELILVNKNWGSVAISTIILTRFGSNTSADIISYARLRISLALELIYSFLF